MSKKSSKNSTSFSADVQPKRKNRNCPFMSSGWIGAVGCGRNKCEVWCETCECCSLSSRCNCALW